MIARPTTHWLFFGSPLVFQPFRSVPLKGITTFPFSCAGTSPRLRPRHTAQALQTNTARGIQSSFVVIHETALLRVRDKRPGGICQPDSDAADDVRQMDRPELRPGRGLCLR